ncbi:MAG: xanthine dehydrogenase family protein subunit M [Candidatus Eiseniibacteriota bacterium]|jgi:carbon-monoxide dehydrogenase medium subunit
MRLCDFAYHRPRTAAEACELARSLGDGAYFLAGGTELVPDFKRGAETARHLISLRDVEGLSDIRRSGDFLVIGAMATMATIARSDEVRRAVPALADAAGWIGGEQIRHQATIGGNFCRAVPCADTPPVCIAADAQVRLLDGAAARRTLPAAEFFTGPRRTVRAQGELLIEILVPVQPPHSATSYQRFALRRGMAVAVAAVAARLTIEDGIVSDARVVLGAVAPVPLVASDCARTLVGQPPGDAVFADAAARAAAEARPITDIRGSAAYRQELIRVLAQRAFTEAAARAATG